MTVSRSIFISKCKSACTAIGRSCYLGREAAKERCRELQQKRKETDVELKRKEAEIARLQEQNRQLQQRIVELEAEQARPQPVTLPLGVPPREMQYGAGFIELCVNLARELGLRPTCRALRVFFRWLKVEVAVPA